VVRFVIGFSLVLLPVFVTCPGCSRGERADKPKGRPAAPVVVETAAHRDVPVVLEAVGTVETPAQVSVKSMVSGEILNVHFREGDDVVRGQVLFTIDPRPFESALRKADADLARIRTQLATARANGERYGRLLGEGIVTAEQADSYRTQAEALAADLAAQQALIESLRVQLSYCTIRSPLAGRTGSLSIHAGNLVKANDTVSLVTVNQITPIAISFTLPEADLSRLRTAHARRTLQVEAVPSGEGGRPERGRVIFIDNAIDPATGTIRVKAEFANGGRRLWPGQFAAVRLTLDVLPAAVVVSSPAVQIGQQGIYVYVVGGDGHAELRPVTAGVRSGGYTVITAGIAAGDRVVVDGQLRLAPGMKVDVSNGGRPGPATGRQGSYSGARPAPGRTTSP
jgi:multidrug efflux system membrane fusion protein